LSPCLRARNLVFINVLSTFDLVEIFQNFDALVHREENRLRFIVLNTSREDNLKIPPMALPSIGQCPEASNVAAGARKDARLRTAGLLENIR
jgi:hypothetical protein